MKKALIAFLVAALAVLLAATAVGAQPDKVINPPQLKHGILIHYAQPDWAPPDYEAPDWVPPLGVPGWVAIPPQGGGVSPARPRPPEPRDYYFELLGPKWATTSLPVSYVIDTDYAPAGAEAQVGLAFEAWDDATSAELYNDYTVNTTANPSLQAADDVNVVCWRLIAGLGTAIAITSYWYYDSNDDGKLSAGDEWRDMDIIFNLKFKWGIDTDGELAGYTLPKGYYDVRNIATHEAGHVTGLADLYNAVDREMTMYGYSTARETKKISLEQGDRAGCAALYP